MTASAIKRTLVAGAAALAIGAVAFGAVGAQTPTPTPSSPQATPQPGQRPQREQLRQQLQQRHEQYLSALASKLGVSVDRLKQAMEEARREVGLGQRGPDLHPGLGFSRLAFGISIETAAKALGMTPEQLRQELPGKSLADVARARNVDVARVTDALKAEANARIDEAARNGRITAEQATQMKQRAAAQIDQAVNRQVPSGPLFRGPRPGERRGS